MENPFKEGDRVKILRSGIELEAVVRTTWRHEVQVRVQSGELLWRTSKTISRAPETGAAAPAEGQKDEPLPPADNFPICEESTIEVESQPTNDPVTHVARKGKQRRKSKKRAPGDGRKLMSDNAFDQ